MIQAIYASHHLVGRFLLVMLEEIAGSEIYRCMLIFRRSGVWDLVI